ncbi:MAG: hypothetical protein WBE38_09730, partial [Terracidiphilus sp.]
MVITLSARFLPLAIIPARQVVLFRWGAFREIPCQKLGLVFQVDVLNVVLVYPLPSKMCVKQFGLPFWFPIRFSMALAPSIK